MAGIGNLFGEMAPRLGTATFEEANTRIANELNQVGFIPLSRVGLDMVCRHP